MNARHFCLPLLAASLMTAWALPSQAADHKKTQKSHAAAAVPHPHAGHWDYHGAVSPRHWGSIDPSYVLCKSGKAQSPIDIQGTQNSTPTPIQFGYTPAGAEVLNNGHTIQINLTGAGGIKLDGVDFSLLQFHFHTPSEEKIRGEVYPMVAHLVHKSAAGALAVVAVLFELGDENQALKAVFAGLPAKEGDTLKLPANFDVTALLPAYKGYYQFSGSLTTPPCSEGVHWQVMKQRMELSKAQLAAFQKLYKMNARPVQPLHGRKVEER